MIQRKGILLLMAGALSMGFVACGNDDSEGTEGEGGKVIVNPSNVFTGERPKVVAGMSMSYNDAGLVTEINDIDGEKITFEYQNVTRVGGKEYDVKMIVVDRETYVFNMQLNEQGFVKHCDEDSDTWDFGYNDDGQLNYMKRSEGGNEVTKVTYQNGDAVKMTMVSEDGPDTGMETTILYTSDEVKTPIENKGCLMPFDIGLRVDMDEMKYAYYAGLLGKATKHLPVKNKDFTLNWTLNNAGYPIKLVIPEDSSPFNTYTFEW